MNNTGVKVGFNCPELTLSMRVFGSHNSAYAFWHMVDLHTYYITRNLDWTAQCGACFARPTSMHDILIGFINDRSRKVMASKVFVLV